MIETSKGRELVGETFDVFEKNYPDDSYWYARSFHNGEIVETLVDSTAFGSVGFSRYEIDISPENEKKLARYYYEQSVREAWALRAELIALARKCKLHTYHELKELRRLYSKKQFEEIVRLLATKSFRSTFRKSLDAQIRAWLEESEHVHRTPISDKQLSALMFKPWRAGNVWVH